MLASSAAYSWEDCLRTKSQVYDAAADFLPGYIANKNPNGCWTYGWTTDLLGPLTIYPNTGISPLDNHPQTWYDPNNDSGRSPVVTRNWNGDYNDGNVTWPAGALLLTGCGIDGHSYSHVIWTAPKKGKYLLSATFYAAQNYIDADVHILVKHKSVFDASFTENGSKRTFVKELQLSVGDAIDFASGPNGAFYQHPAYTGLIADVIRLEQNGGDNHHNKQPN